ncbi:Poxc laccase transcription factor [Mycena sanguinolenta]|uniref:Poxc laccase transcription factor n=1 Tax=Mycena sanguinolenta TaxID=230812 RepID=A0A8H6XE73_9AGAR|nr:Poxc laccase transcription factor [Mycena sanguinolenta]
MSHFQPSTSRAFRVLCRSRRDPASCRFSASNSRLATDSSVPALYSPRDIRLDVTLSFIPPISQLKPHLNGPRRTPVPCPLRSTRLPTCILLTSSSWDLQATRWNRSSIPTWSPSSDICLDLHDLHSLRTKFLLLIHDLVRALRSSGVAASYVLVPSSSSRCILCAGACGDLASAIDKLQKTSLPDDTRPNVLLADLGCPCLVVI